MEYGRIHGHDDKCLKPEWIGEGELVMLQEQLEEQSMYRRSSREREKTEPGICSKGQHL